MLSASRQAWTAARMPVVQSTRWYSEGVKRSGRTAKEGAAPPPPPPAAPTVLETFGADPYLSKIAAGIMIGSLGVGVYAQMAGLDLSLEEGSAMDKIASGSGLLSMGSGLYFGIKHGRVAHKVPLVGMTLYGVAGTIVGGALGGLGSIAMAKTGGLIGGMIQEQMKSFK